VRFRLARGLDAPSSEAPPRSRISWAHCLHTCSPTGAFNALTFAGAQVKDESTPRRAWESRPDAVPPTPSVRPSPPLCDAVRHGQRQSCDTVPPTLVRLMRRALERGQCNPRRGDRRLLHACPGLHCDVRPAGPVTSVAIVAVRPSPPPQHHPGHCITIPCTVGVRGDKTPPRRLLYALQPPISRTLESMYG
jgi:hypothetical protein